MSQLFLISILILLSSIFSILLALIVERVVKSKKGFLMGAWSIIIMMGLVFSYITYMQYESYLKVIS